MQRVPDRPSVAMLRALHREVGSRSGTRTERGYKKSGAHHHQGCALPDNEDARPWLTIANLPRVCLAWEGLGR